DSDTAKFKQKLGNKTFYFCSKQCLDRFTAAPEKYEKLASALEKQDLHDYAAELKTDGEPAAGKPVRLEVAIRYADSKELVKEFGDLRFELKLQGEPLTMERPALLTYVIRDRRGRPVRDMQPFIGAMGHLLAISQDGKEVIHTHVLQSASRPGMGGGREPFRV